MQDCPCNDESGQGQLYAGSAATLLILLASLACSPIVYTKECSMILEAMVLSSALIIAEEVSAGGGCGEVE